MKRILAIGLILLGSLGTGACTKQQVRLFQTAIECRKAHMVKCIAKYDQWGMYQLQGQHPYVCYEDMKCWNCHTMGNKVCGPIKRHK